MITVCDLCGRPLRRSKNLAGVLAHNRARRGDWRGNDVIVKVERDYVDSSRTALNSSDYTVTFYWPGGDNARTKWADWRVLLDWLKSRRSWSIARVTFDLPVYESIESSPCAPRLAAFRRDVAPLTCHAYKS